MLCVNERAAAIRASAVAAFCEDGLPALLRCCDDVICCSGPWLNRTSLLNFADSQGLETEVKRELGRIRESFRRGPLTSGLEWAGLYFSHLAMRGWRVSGWSGFRWFLVALLLVGLVGNCVSLAAFRHLSRTGGRVYVYQVAIVASDIATLIFSFFFAFAFFMLDAYDAFTQTNLVMAIAVVLFTTAMLSSRWVFLGSLLDRRQAFLTPLAYKTLDHPRRVFRLCFLSAIFALIICAATLFPFHLHPLLNPAPPAHARQRLCATYSPRYVEESARAWGRCVGYPAFGYMWEEIGSSRWELAFRTTENANTGPYIAPSSGVMFVALLAFTDLAIAVLCRILLRLLHFNNQRRRELRAGRDTADADEAKKTRILLYLCVLVFLQMITITASFLCGEVSKLSKFPSTFSEVRDFRFPHLAAGVCASSLTGVWNFAPLSKSAGILWRSFSLTHSSAPLSSPSSSQRPSRPLRQQIESFRTLRLARDYKAYNSAHE